MSSNKSIDTLIKDIYSVFDGKGVEVPREEIEEFGKKLADLLVSRILPKTERPTLRISNLGTNCDRKLWYTVNTPELGERLDGKTRFKFLYGDLLEALLLFAARIAGHDVSGEQDEASLHGVVGHRDAVIDGRLIDVKSASSYSFRKFANGDLHLGELSNDPFGYVDQIQGYAAAFSDDATVTDKENVSFLVIDKVTGDLTLDTHKVRERDWASIVGRKESMLRGPLPERGFSDLPEGKSGNRRLGIECSYCQFKNECWPGLRTFVYSRRPIFLTRVVKEPRVTEAIQDATLEDF